MGGMIPYPTSGKKLPRSWAEGVTDAANAVRQIGSAGMLVREMGPLGSGAEALPENKRNRGSGGNAIPQPFDPTFEKDAETGNIHLSAIGKGYAPWGRKLLEASWPDSNSDVWTATWARLGLKINHPTEWYGVGPVSEIILLGSYRNEQGASTQPIFPESTDAITYLPLYDFKDGRITLDLRCYLALGVYE